MTARRAAPAPGTRWTPFTTEHRPRPGALGMTEEEREALRRRESVGVVGPEGEVLVVRREAAPRYVNAAWHGRVRTYVLYGVDVDPDEITAREILAETLNVDLATV